MNQEFCKRGGTSPPVGNLDEECPRADWEQPGTWPTSRKDADVDEATIRRFWAKVDRRNPDDCWEWQAYRDRKGYGQFHVGGRATGRVLYVQRIAYSLEVGPIPDGLFVCHRCDNPPCVNPAHLFVGTNLDNVRDMIAKGRDRRPSGESHPRAKLTRDQVRWIRRRYAAGGITQTALARQFGVNNGTLSRAIRGHTWNEGAA